LALSGGADSTALALAATAVVGSLPGKPSLAACYIDHGMRALAEREAEQASVHQLCDRLDLALVTVGVDVAAERAARRTSWEDAARRCRYQAMAGQAALLGARTVLTGHTADDQVETILLRLLRGTGVEGLRGIAAVSRPWGEGAPLLCRPLLFARHTETEAYCAARGQSWAIDRSNASPRFLRNRVRLELLPLMRTMNPNVGTALLRLGAQAEELAVWNDRTVMEHVELLWQAGGDGGGMLRCPTAPLPAALSSRVVAFVLARLLNAPGPPSQRQVAAVQRLWQGRVGRRLDLSNGWLAYAEREGIRFGLEPSASAPAWSEGRWQVAYGCTEIPGWRVYLREADAAGAPSAACDLGEPANELLQAHIALESGLMLSDLSVGFWQPGERMRPAGMTGTKKLQDIFVNEKVPARRRHTTPLLFLGAACIWMVGVKRSAAAPARLPGGRSVQLLFERASEADPLT